MLLLLLEYAVILRYTKKSSSLIDRLRVFAASSTEAGVTEAGPIDHAVAPEVAMILTVYAFFKIAESLKIGTYYCDLLVADGDRFLRIFLETLNFSFGV